MPTPKPLIVAHRGLHKDLPENSLEAMNAAFAAGITAVEWDVRRTADDAPVILHDDKLDRTTTGQGHLAGFRLADLESIRLKHNNQPTHCQIPLLAEAFETNDDAVPRAARIFVVEVKERFPALNAAVLQECAKVKGSIVLQSFIPEVLTDLRSIDPSRQYAILCGNAEELAAGIAAGWPRVNMHHKLATQSVVEDLRRNGRQIGVWTVNAEADILRMIDLRVDTLITDDPLLVRELVERYWR